MGDIQSSAQVPAVRTRARRHPCVALCFGLVIAMFAAPLPAVADTEIDGELRGKKFHWQDRYRFLLTETVRLRSVIEQERALYAGANRRNYRRGTKRHSHRKIIDKAELDLAELESQLENFEDEARLGGAQRGWLTQVEIEFEDAERRPAVTVGPGDEGRNPLYLRDSDSDSDSDD